MSTLEKVQRLEALCASGHTDVFLDKALDKLIAHQVANRQSEIDVIRQDLRAFEKKYTLDSQTFFEKYQNWQSSRTKSSRADRRRLGTDRQ